MSHEVWNQLIVQLLEMFLRSWASPKYVFCSVLSSSHTYRFRQRSDSSTTYGIELCCDQWRTHSNQWTLNCQKTQKWTPLNKISGSPLLQMHLVGNGFSVLVYLCVYLVKNAYSLGTPVNLLFDFCEAYIILLGVCRSHISTRGLKVAYIGQIHLGKYMHIAAGSLYSWVYDIFCRFLGQAI